MIASAQFTIISLCDVVTSGTPPENPYEGQLWVDTSVTPPETKIWDGNEWVVQNDIETIRTTISILTEKDAQFQQTIDGLNSYVATLTEAVETVSGVLFVPVVQEVVVEEGAPQEGVGVYREVELVGQEEAEAGHLDAVGEDGGGAMLDGCPCQRQTTGSV